jgi:hypothetical protein
VINMEGNSVRRSRYYNVDGPLADGVTVMKEPPSNPRSWTWPPSHENGREDRRRRHAELSLKAWQHCMARNTG